MARRSGRRPGESGTRAAILDAATAEFAEFGYERATIRGIARRAGVDPALVHHYFTNKQQVFVTAMQFPADPAEIAGRLLDKGRDHVGTALAGLLAETWEPEANRAPFVALIRSAVSNEQAAAMMREFATEALIARVAGELGEPDARLRATLVASQIIGLIIARYVIKLEPLASTPLEQLTAAIGPTIQRYLTGDIGLPAGGRPDVPEAAAPTAVRTGQDPELLDDRRGSVK